MTKTPEQAIEAARRQSNRGPSFAAGMCLQRVRLCFGVGSGALDATKAWEAADHKHRTTTTRDIPRGVPIFWTGGSGGHGHIAISTGNGRCISTDIHRRGFFDEVPITEINRRWGSSLRFQGWTEDINGVRVWSPPAPPRTEPKAPQLTPYDELYNGVEALVKRLGPHVAKKYTARRRLVDGLTALVKAAPVPASRKAKR
jgi:hypothetical protein